MGTFMTGDFHQADVLLSVKLGGWGFGPVQLQTEKQKAMLLSHPR